MDRFHGMRRCILCYKINLFMHSCMKYFTNKLKRSENNLQCKLLAKFCEMNYFGTSSTGPVPICQSRKQEFFLLKIIYNCNIHTYMFV